MIKRNANIFSKNDMDMGRTNLAKHHICHMWQRRPPFPVNLRDLASLRLEGMQAKYSAGVCRWSIHCLTGMEPLVVRCPPIGKERPRPIRGLSAIQCGVIEGMRGRPQPIRGFSAIGCGEYYCLLLETHIN